MVGTKVFTSTFENYFRCAIFNRTNERNTIRTLSWTRYCYVKRVTMFTQSLPVNFFYFRMFWTFIHICHYVIPIAHFNAFTYPLFN